MNEQAAHLVDRVLPQAPYRQWVLTLPGELARVVAFDADLATAVFGVFADELSRWQRERANDLGIADPQTGSLLEIQRFADGARLWTRTLTRWSPTGSSSQAPMTIARASSGRTLPPMRTLRVVSRVEHRLTRVLARWRAWRQRDSANDSDAADILPACAEVLPTEFVRLSSQNGPQQRRPAPKKPLCARSPGGLELHAEVTIASHDRKGLERLCRYLSRPPIPQERLERRRDGKYVLSLKRTWQGGVKAVVFEPLDLIARLAALVPAPYLALRRFHGVFGPNHHLRSVIVPTPSADSALPVAPKRPGRMNWADLLMRVWAIDALKCPPLRWQDAGHRRHPRPRCDHGHPGCRPLGQVGHAGYRTSHRQSAGRAGRGLTFLRSSRTWTKAPLRPETRTNPVESASSGPTITHRPVCDPLWRSEWSPSKGWRPRRTRRT